MVNECSGLRQRLDLGAVYALCFENEKKFNQSVVIWISVS